ncbi:cation efflux family protein [Xylaria sp. CBS 124048]|nr:cation efflux family protein [Xylaria sp. CBS 124048]
MAFFKLTAKQKLITVICISTLFFLAELITAFYTASLALLADAFHYLNDLIGFAIALAAIHVSERAQSPQNFSFGWARAQLLGAFFNGVFLLALGLSIFLQSIERFIFVKTVEKPLLVLIIGSIGLFLNILSATVLHEHHGHSHGHGHGHSHSHSHGHGHNHSHDDHIACESGLEHDHGHDNIEAAIPMSRIPSDDTSAPSSVHAEHRHNAVKLDAQGHDLGMMSVLIHVISDALNNLATIIAALVIWQSSSPLRYYADPAVSVIISIMIFVSSIPLVKNSGEILMQSAPRGVNIEDVKHDLEKIPGVQSVHDLHIWGLNQSRAIASAHVVVANNQLQEFMDQASVAAECLQAYGIDSLTLQPKLVGPGPAPHPLTIQDPGVLSGNISDNSAECESTGKNETAPAPTDSSLRRLARMTNRS